MNNLDWASPLVLQMIAFVERRRHSFSVKGEMCSTPAKRIFPLVATRLVGISHWGGFFFFFLWNFIEEFVAFGQKPLCRYMSMIWFQVIFLAALSSVEVSCLRVSLNSSLFGQSYELHAFVGWKEAWPIVWCRREEWGSCLWNNIRQWYYRWWLTIIIFGSEGLVITTHCSIIVWLRPQTNSEGPGLFGRGELVRYSTLKTHIKIVLCLLAFLNK